MLIDRIGVTVNQRLHVLGCPIKIWPTLTPLIGPLILLLSLRKGGWIYTISQNRLVIWGLPSLIKILLSHHIFDVRLLTHPHDQHYWTWFVDINGGWIDDGNLIACGSWRDSDTTLEVVVGTNTTLQNRFVRWWLLTYKHIVRLSPIRCGTLNTLICCSTTPS